MSDGNSDNVRLALRRFDHLSDLGDEQILELAQQVSVARAGAGTCLLELGSNEKHLLYLVEGEVELVAEDGARRVIRHTDAAAMAPVARLRPSRYRVRARSQVRYLLIDHEIVDRLARQERIDGMRVSEADITIDADSADDPASHPLMFDVFEDINRGVILLPSQGEIAISVGRALQHAGNDVARMTEILSACPVIALKVVRAAIGQGSRARSVRSIRDAVALLGTDQVVELGVQSVLRESLRLHEKATRHHMEQWWEMTVRVAAACSAIARISERFDPELAALIGLSHSFGEAVLLQYVERHGDMEKDPALAKAVSHNRAQVGRILAVLWDLPRELLEATTEADNWYHDDNAEASYVDILLVARWFAHSSVGDYENLPRIGTMPAFDRIGIKSASDDFQRSVELAASQAVSRSKAVLSLY
jgi:HD-like signal output (HDOD) protein